MKRHLNLYIDITLHYINVVDMIGRIHADIFFQERYLVNEVNVKIKLVRSKDAFCIMSANDHKAVIVKSVLFVRKVKLSPSVVLAHAKALENGTAKISYTTRSVQDGDYSGWVSRR